MSDLNFIPPASDLLTASQNFNTASLPTSGAGAFAPKRYNERPDTRANHGAHRDTRIASSPLNHVRLNLPLDYIASNPDYEFCMVTYQSMGETLDKNIEDAVRRRYAPILRNEHPSLERNHTMAAFYKNDDRTNDYYTINGHIGMKRLKDDGVIERDYFAKLTHEHDRKIRSHSGEGVAGLRTVMDERQYARAI